MLWGGAEGPAWGRWLVQDLESRAGLWGLRAGGPVSGRRPESAGLGLRRGIAAAGSGRQGRQRRGCFKDQEGRAGEPGRHWRGVSRQEATPVLSELRQTPQSRRGRGASSSPPAPSPPAQDVLCLRAARGGLSVPTCDPVCGLTAVADDSKFGSEFSVAHGLLLSQPI